MVGGQENPNYSPSSNWEDTGIEKECEDGNSHINDELITIPFNPDDIDVITRNTTVDLLLSRIKSDLINLQPDFQRSRGIWDDQRQSRLIESLLLRIPLPVLYAAEGEKDNWDIVDGIQRLFSISRFIDPQIVDSTPLRLKNLEFLGEYEGKKFEELAPRLQLRLRESELSIHLIRKGTPSDVKFNIFARINTGGITLASQELRHAIVPGKSREILEEWATFDVFKQATDHSIRSIRMDDRELVLRFIAFYHRGIESYTRPGIDAFLIDTMKEMNNLSDVELNKIRCAFSQSMKTARTVFGKRAFRKTSQPKHGKRRPINKALFEAISVNFGKLEPDQLQKIVHHKTAVIKGVKKLCAEADFDASISVGTAGITKVKQRFSDVKDMLEEVLTSA